MTRGRSISRSADVLSAITIALMALTALGGLMAPGEYRDNPLVASGWWGNDLVTLAVATPLLSAAWWAARRGGTRATLLWIGLLDYAFYNYAFYLFGTAFNAFFLLYVAIFTVAGFGLIAALAGLDAPTIAARFDDATPVRAVSAVLLVIAVGLGGFHVAVAIGSALSGEPPAIVQAVGHPTNVIAALDLPFVVAVSALAAVWLWRRQPWGYVLAIVITVKGAVYMFALSAATISAVRAGVADDVSAVGLWGGIGVGCGVAAWALLRHMTRVA